MTHGIWTTICGGVTGPRSAWLKEDGMPVIFATQAEAAARAAQLTAATALRGGYTPSGRPIAQQSFHAQEQHLMAARAKAEYARQLLQAAPARGRLH